MSEIMSFTEYAGSGRGLRARPTTPIDVVASPSNIDSIFYQIKPMPGGPLGPEVPLVVADVLFDVPRKWFKSPDGYTLLIPIPGSAWPTPGLYRIIVTLVPKDAGGTPRPDLAFSEVWECTAIAPAG